MEKMFEMMLKSMGFEPNQMRGNIETAAKIFKAMADQLNRVEQKLDLLLNESPPVKSLVELPANDKTN